MSQLSSVESPTKSAPTPALKPALKAVLGSLEVNLDAELARYRRQKRAEQADPFSVPGAQKSWSGIDLPSLESRAANGQQLEGRSNSPHSARLEAEPMPQEFPASSQNPQGLALASVDAKLESQDISSEEASLESLESEPDAGEPDDYLESSEELLKSIDEDGAEVKPESTQKKSRFPSSLLTPLGLGSMLLFLAASVALVYVATDPNGLGFGLGRVLSGKSADSETGAKEDDPKNAEAKSQATSLPRSPNLADKEFAPVDLDTLGTLEPKTNSSSSLPEQPTGQAAPTTAVANSSSTASSGLEKIDSVLLPESIQKNNQTTTGATTGTTTQATTGALTATNTAPTATSTEPKTPLANGTAQTSPETLPPPAVPEYVEPLGEYLPDFYYLLMEYKNDNSLRQARAWIPDAYVREFPIGVRIQLAALEDEALAKQTLEELKQVGLPALLYRP